MQATKIIRIFLLIGSLRGIYDIPTMLNPTRSEAYSRINGGIGSQNYWSGFPGRTSTTFDPSMAGVKAMYNINSLAPFGGDRYTGYDSMSQRWTPPGTASSVYYPTPAGISESTSADSTQMDFNSLAYRNFYDRYYEFYHKNLDILNSKINVRKNPHQFDKDNSSYYNSKTFDPLSNYFSGTSRETAFFGGNIPDIKISRDYSLPARRLKLQSSSKTLRKVTPKVIRNLRGKVKDIKKALRVIEQANKKQNRRLRDTQRTRKLNV
jgi:hypothetical protein